MRHVPLVVVTTIELLSLLHMAVSASQISLKARAKRAYMEGDIMLGVLFPMHKQSDKKNDYRQACGVIWEGYGIHRLEQFFRTVDEINKRTDILPGITLGYDVRDSCWTIPVALEQSIDFIRNKIGTLDKQMAGSDSTAASQVRNTECVPQQRGKTIAALIGPGSSTISGPIQNVLQLFEIPEIDFGATAVELSDKNKHRFFSRVVPSDRQQARALVDIILRHNWTYIHAVHTEGMYGENGMEEFKSMLSKTSACIAVDKKLKSNVPTGDNQYLELLSEIRSKGKDKAKVIVCFCDGLAIRGIFNATVAYRQIHPEFDGKFMVIGSDGWNVREDVVKGLENIANGGISIKLHSPPIEDFEVYLSRINPLNNSRNPWFKEFWEWRFNCTFQQELYGWRKPCDPSSPQQRIDPEQVEQDAKLGFVVNAVYALAHAFHNMLLSLCPDRPDFSDCQHINQTINGTMVFNFLRNVTFTSFSNDSIKFDEFMDGVGRYEIMNYRYNESAVGPHGQQGTYEYQKIGWWDSGNLWMKELVKWPNNSSSEADRIIESVCSKPCEKGKVKKIQEGGVPCCWSCQQCLENEYIISDSRCMPCQPGWWPDNNLTACLPLDIEYKSLTDRDSIICVVFAVFGLLSCAFVLIIFVRHNSTPVVKASTRELTYIILTGVALAYFNTLPLLMKPTLVSCYFTRILPGLSFSLIYGALSTKTNRIARILSGSKKKIITRKPRFLSASAQVVITCIIVGTECVIITLMLILEPADSVLDYPSQRQVLLKCNTTDYGQMVPFGFDMFLIAMCTLYAVRTRNMPENFQEAKFIGLCMYTTCFVWASFLPIYYNSESRMTAMSLCSSTSASAVLVFLFYPKIYIMVYQPEKNVKSAFQNGEQQGETQSRYDSYSSHPGGHDTPSIDLMKRNERGSIGGSADIKQRFPAAAKQYQSSTASGEHDDAADKLAEAIKPTVQKMKKPRTISELMHQRRMSVASVGSAERLLAAALRQSRNSMVPFGGIAGPGGSSLGSEDYKGVRERSSSSSSSTSSSSTSSNASSHASSSHTPGSTPNKQQQHKQRSETSDTTSTPSKKSEHEGEGEQTAALVDDKDRLTLPASSNVSLPRPSPIPEEDEDAVDTSSPHTKSKRSSVSSVMKPVHKEPPPPPQQPHEASDSGSMTYVNLDAINAAKRIPPAPPLPPKPPRLMSGASAIAGRLIDQLYTASRVNDQRLAALKVKIPSGPPRPVSPTEVRSSGDRRRRQKAGTIHRFISTKMSNSLKSASRRRKAERADSSSSTNAESETIRPAYLPGIAATVTSSKLGTDQQSFLVSPMSSTSTDFVPKLKVPVDDTSLYSPTEASEATTVATAGGSNVQSTLKLSVEASTGINNDSLSYAGDSSTASSPSMDINARIAIAEAKHRRLLQLGITGPSTPLATVNLFERSHSSLWRDQRSMGANNSSSNARMLSVRGASGVLDSARTRGLASSVSSALSEDTLADLPSIEELPISGMRLLDDEEAQAMRFKEYMSDMGVDVDMSVFQSTEV